MLKKYYFIEFVEKEICVLFFQEVQKISKFRTLQQIIVRCTYRNAKNYFQKNFK